MISTTSEKPKRLVFVSEYFYPANNAPGARFKPLVAELAKYFKIEIYTSKISKEVANYDIHCNILPFPPNQKRTISRLFREALYGFETFVRLYFSKGEIYYITSPSFINCIFAACYCILFRKRYVIDIRDDYPRVYFEAGLISEHGLIARCLSWVERKMCFSSVLVVAATEGLKTNIEKYHKNDVWLMRNGYSEAIFKPNECKFESFTLVFHGIISNYQDIDLLIALGKMISDKKLDIQIKVIGYGSQDFKLKDNLPSSISYLGPKPYHEIPEIISKSHLGLSFRKPGKISHDSFPVKTYEYIGVGIPIIVTPISEAGCYVSNSGIGFQFDPYDKKAILEKIIEISRSPELYNTLTSNLKGIRSQFSRESICKELADYMGSRL